MAMHDVEQKLLAQLAKEANATNPLLSSALYQVLGLSVILSRRLIRARQTRKLDPTRDTKSLDLYHHIIWLSREGLSLTETYILPYAEAEGASPELEIFGAKLRASFYHVFCLFHNNPPVTTLNPLQSASPAPPARPGSAQSPRPGNGQQSRQTTSRSPTAGQQGKVSQDPRRDNDAQQQLPQENPHRTRQAALRDTIPSMTSEASYVTNPYPNVVTPPPGLRPLPAVPQPSSFLLPALNYIPIATSAFQRAMTLATELLPGSSPLRIAVALEFCAFRWDCLHDHSGSRRMARRAIQNVYKAEEGMHDDEFEDAAMLVGTLGRMMRRQDADDTPLLGAGSPPSARAVGVTPNIPPMPLDLIQESPAQGPQQSTSSGPSSGLSRAVAGPSNPGREASPPRTPRVVARDSGSRGSRGSGNSPRTSGDRPRSGGERPRSGGDRPRSGGKTPSPRSSPSHNRRR